MAKLCLFYHFRNHSVLYKKVLPDKQGKDFLVFCLQGQHKRHNRRVRNDKIVVVESKTFSKPSRDGILYLIKNPELEKLSVPIRYGKPSRQS